MNTKAAVVIITYTSRGAMMTMSTLCTYPYFVPRTDMSLLSSGYVLSDHIY